MVDDGSADATARIVEDIAKEEPNVRLVRQKNHRQLFTEVKVTDISAG